MPIKLGWVTCKRMSIREIASECGFNLSAVRLNGAKENYNNLVISQVTKSVIGKLDEAWEEKTHGQLAKVDQGIYIISFSDDICVAYKNRQSHIIYRSE